MITIEIKTDNAAFEDGDGVFEVSRILKKLAEKIESGPPVTEENKIRLLDVNGNHVGFYNCE